MTDFIFKFKGLPDLRDPALDTLRNRLPSEALVTPKTSELVEVRLAAPSIVSLLPLLQQEFGDAWDVSLPSYAEIKAPGIDWSKVRDKFGN